MNLLSLKYLARLVPISCMCPWSHSGKQANAGLVMVACRYESQFIHALHDY